ncbi:hypothetical protein GCM10027575_19830 [Phytohabitans suffuscus]
MLAVVPSWLATARMDTAARPPDVAIRIAAVAMSAKPYSGAGPRAPRRGRAHSDGSSTLLV